MILGSDWLIMPVLYSQHNKFTNQAKYILEASLTFVGLLITGYIFATYYI